MNYLCFMTFMYKNFECRYGETHVKSLYVRATILHRFENRIRETVAIEVAVTLGLHRERVYVFSRGKKAFAKSDDGP